MQIEFIVPCQPQAVLSCVERVRQARALASACEVTWPVGVKASGHACTWDVCPFRDTCMSQFQLIAVTIFGSTCII